jgi:hypothetical protein
LSRSNNAPFTERKAQGDSMTLLHYGLMTVHQFLGFTVFFMLCLGMWGDALNGFAIEDSTGAGQNIEHYQKNVHVWSALVAIGFCIYLQQLAVYIWFYSR